MLHRIGMLFALLGALALGGAGYAPVQAETLFEAAPITMDHEAADEMQAFMAAQHACCPEGSTGHALIDQGLGHVSSDCDDFAGCTDGPCGLTTAVSAMLQDAPWSLAWQARVVHVEQRVYPPADIMPARPEHPPRA